METKEEKITEIKAMRKDAKEYGNYMHFDFKETVKARCKKMGLDPHLVFCKQDDFDSIINKGNFLEFKA